jgi:hypothetical protein
MIVTGPALRPRKFGKAISLPLGKAAMVPISAVKVAHREIEMAGEIYCPLNFIVYALL